MSSPSGSWVGDGDGSRASAYGRSRKLRSGVAWLAVVSLGVAGFVAAERIRYNFANPERFFVHRLPPADPTPPVSDRVVLVVSDGLRDDIARTLPNIKALADRPDAAFRRAVTGVPSLSRPGSIALLCGVGPNQSGFPLNESRGVVDVECLFDVVAASGGRSAVGGVGEGFSARFDPSETHVFARTRSEDESAYVPDDQESFDLSLRALESDARFVYLYFPDVDEQSHLYGALSEPALEAAVRFDSYLGEIASRLDLDRETLVVTSDHGHRDQGGHGGYEWLARRSPLLMVGRGVKGGSTADAAQVDIAPTIAALLGVGRPRHAEGKPLFESLDLPDETRAAVFDAHERALRHKLRADLEAISGRPAADGNSEVLRLQVEEARWTRGVREAVRRLPAALVLVAVVSAVLWLTGGANLAGLASGLAGVVAFAAVIFGAGWRLTISQFNVESDETRLTVSLLAASVIALVVASAILAALRRIRRVYGKRDAVAAWDPAETSVAASMLTAAAALQALAGAFVAWTLFYYGVSYSWRLPDLRVGLPVAWAMYGAGFVASAAVIGGSAAAIVGWLRRLAGHEARTREKLSDRAGEADRRTPAELERRPT